MLLGRPTTPSAAPPTDLAAALAGAAAANGHRPAVTVLRPERREEQGFASLAQWASKGAHFLELECELEVGDELGLMGPPGWLPVAVCLAAWWAGVTVVVDGAAAVVVAHESVAPAQGDVYVWGDAIDGSPLVDARHDAYVAAVQTFPDRPPAPRAYPDLVALRVGARTWTHAELLAETGADTWIIGAAVHPLLTGRPATIDLSNPRP